MQIFESSTYPQSTPSNKHDDKSDAAAILDVEKLKASRNYAQYKQEWAAPTEQQKEDQMSTKFLPFITNTSSTESIFKAMMQRSKDVDKGLIATVFSAIVRTGIDDIRTMLENKEIPSYSKGLQIIAEKYKASEIETDFVEYVGHFLYFYNFKSDEYALEDMAIFVAVCASEKLKDWKKLGIKYAPDDLIKNFEINKNLSEINLHFNSISGIPVGFHSFYEFIAFTFLASNKKIKEVINPKFIGKKDSTYERSMSYPIADYIEAAVETPYTILHGDVTDASQ